MTHWDRNCFKITLTNISVTLKIKLYDKCHKYLGSTTITVNYLPGSTTSTDYDYYSEKTNPSNVTFELFAPYGVGINEGGDYYFNIVGMYENNNTVVNGVNLSGTAKAMNFDEVTGVFSAGLSLFVRTLYYEVYEIPYIGKSKPVKVKFKRQFRKMHALNSLKVDFVKRNKTIRTCTTKMWGQTKERKSEMLL